MDAETQQRLDKVVKEFHAFWKANGEPHPSSNEYLRLNRIFFYGQGVSHGIVLANKINDEITRRLGED